VIGIGASIFAANYAVLAYALSLGLDWPILMARALLGVV